MEDTHRSRRFLHRGDSNTGNCGTVSKRKHEKSSIEESRVTQVIFRPKKPGKRAHSSACGVLMISNMRP